jgi:hypothetical protein
MVESMVYRIKNISIGFLMSYLIFIIEILFLSYYFFIIIGNVSYGLIGLIVLGITSLGYPLIYSKSLKYEISKEQNMDN